MWSSVDLAADGSPAGPVAPGRLSPRPPRSARRARRRAAWPPRGARSSAPWPRASPTPPGPTARPRRSAAPPRRPRSRTPAGARRCRTPPLPRPFAWASAVRLLAATRGLAGCWWPRSAWASAWRRARRGHAGTPASRRRSCAGRGRRARSCGCRSRPAAPGRGRPAAATRGTPRSAVLQRLPALQVEMVGGLVEDQQVRAGVDEDRQRQAPALTARRARRAASRHPRRRTGSGRAARASGRA